MRFNSCRYVYDPSVSHVQDLFEAAKSANDLNSIAAVLARYPYHPDLLNMLICSNILESINHQRTQLRSVCLQWTVLGIHYLVCVTYTRE